MNRKVWIFLPIGVVGALMFQNCQGFGVMNQAQLQSLSCDTPNSCDLDDYALGKISIEVLPPSDYPSGSYSESHVESRVMQIPGTFTSLVRLKDLPAKFACPQTWLRGSRTMLGNSVSTELLNYSVIQQCGYGGR